jgi:hypothetical protein
VWDAESGACRGTCVGHGGGITAMQTVHSNAATRLVTGAADGSIGLWGLDGEMVSLVQQHGSPVMLLKQGGDTLVSGEGNSLICHAAFCRDTSGRPACVACAHLLQCRSRKAASIACNPNRRVTDVVRGGDCPLSVRRCCG